jgi:hypothetical protein
MGRRVNAEITEIRRSLQTFMGIVEGVAANNEILPSELERLQDWITSHESMADVYPISEGLSLCNQILEDGVVDAAEREEFLDFAIRVTGSEKDQDILTLEMRELHGFMNGVASDGRVDEREVHALRNWMQAHQGNKDKWPYSELANLIDDILADGVVTRDEQQQLLAFIEGFVEKSVHDQTRDPDYFADRWMQSDAPVVKTIDQLFDPGGVDTISGRSFCFTGQMESGSRKEVELELEKHGGEPAKSVSKSLDYLVIGGRSNPSWAYATYGRKVEKVMDYRAKGAEISIVGERQYLRAFS